MPADLVTRFAQRASDMASTVERLPSMAAVPGAVARYLDALVLPPALAAQVKADGVNKLVVLPLYPQFSISTSGSSLRLLEHIFKNDPALQGLAHTVIPSWYQRKGYITAQADLIEARPRGAACGLSLSPGRPSPRNLFTSYAMG